uniref:Uncharacterized protein n=1 Tax=Glossina austeni TaxID=7395 RepID=A0A1A9UN69_GLOAU
MNRSSKRRQCFSRKLLNQRISFNKGRDKANTLEDNIVLPTNGSSSGNTILWGLCLPAMKPRSVLSVGTANIVPFSLKFVAILLPNSFSSSELDNTDFIPCEQMFETFVFGLLASLASVVDDIKNKFVTFDVSVDILLASVDDIIGIVEVDFAMLSFNFACNFGVWVIFWEVILLGNVSSAHPLLVRLVSRSVVLLLYLEHLLNDTLTPHMFRAGDTLPDNNTNLIYRKFLSSDRLFHPTTGDLEVVEAALKKKDLLCTPQDYCNAIKTCRGK